MSTTGGFDFIVEIAQDFVGRSVRAQFAQAINSGILPSIPVFALPLELVLGNDGTSLHLIFTDLSTELESGDVFRIRLPFENATLQEGAKITCNFPGAFTMQGTVAATGGDVGIASGSVSTDIETANLDADQKAVVLAMLQPLAVLFQSVSFRGLPVNPSLPGSADPLNLQAMEAHTFSSGGTRSLLFCGTLDKGNPPGNIANRTESLLRQPNNTAMAYSAAAYHRYLFCPRAAANYGVPDPANFVPPCGSHEPITVKEVDKKIIGYEAQLAELRDQLIQDAVLVNGIIKASGTCWSLTAEFDATLHYSVEKGAIKTTFDTSDPALDIDNPWYCWAVPVLGALTNFVIDFALGLTAPGMLFDQIVSGLSKLTALPMNAGSVGTMRFLLRDVSISPEAFILLGNLELPSWAQNAVFGGMPTVSIQSSVTSSNRRQLESGTWTTRVWCQKEEKTYPHIHWQQDQQAILGISALLVPKPLRVEWTLETQDATKKSLETYPVPQPGGKITLRNVPAFFATSAGGTTVVKDVELVCSVTQSGLGLTFQSRAEDGCFFVSAAAKISDCNGAVLRGPGGIQPYDLIGAGTIREFVFLEGDVREIGGGYQQDVQECAQELARSELQAMKGIRSLTRTKPSNIWQPVDLPPPDLVWQNLADIVKAVAARPEVTLGTDEIVQQVAAAHGSAYSRAVAAKLSGLAVAPRVEVLGSPTASPQAQE